MATLFKSGAQDLVEALASKRYSTPEEKKALCEELEKGFAQKFLAGDGRGRFVLPALGPGPDAISALMMLLSLMADTDLPLSQLNSRIPASSVVTRTVTVPWGRRAAAMRAVRQQAERFEVDTLDGIRVLEPDGDWCLILPVDDEACLALYAESDDAAGAGMVLDRWQAVVEGVR